MTKDERQEVIERIFEAILVHMNGYSRKEAKECCWDNKGSDLWDEIESILKKIV